MVDWQEEFDRLNEEKFDNKLPHYEVKMRVMYRYLGRVRYRSKVITLAKGKSDKDTRNTLIHEMCHARFPRERGHSMRFWRLLKHVGNITEINIKLYKKAEIVNNERAV